MNRIRGGYLREFLLCVFIRSHIQMNMCADSVNFFSALAFRKKISSQQFATPSRGSLIGMYKTGDQDSSHQSE